MNILTPVTDRVQTLNGSPIHPNGRYVIYWPQMNRRAASNHAFAHAVAMANQLRLPVLVYEGLTCSYPYANDRIHRFILEGAVDTAADFRDAGAGYMFHLRRRQSDPNDALYRVAQGAAMVVSDDYPTFIAARNNPRAAERLSCRFDVADSSCIVPMSRLEKREYAAYTIRPKIHKLLPQYLQPFLEPVIERRWTEGQPFPDLHTEVSADRITQLIADCEIDHSVPPSISFRGGARAARRHLEMFLDKRLPRYAAERNSPSNHATSNLSPFLHFGHISALEAALAARTRSLETDVPADEFLEELIVRRELAFNYARHAGRPESIGNLPDWAKTTLRKHAVDPRSPNYTREAFASAATHDPLWNATQKEMLLRGKIHGYYRMYWGKKIIEWSATCQDALDTMIYLHDRYALDGRDPNTYTNILWCFGLHDRPWTERPVFGQIRWMSLDGMRRKTDVEAYLKEISFLEQTGKDPFRID
jgi:deoxyribodipyrimidine photo-lyase